MLIGRIERGFGYHFVSHARAQRVAKQTRVKSRLYDQEHSAVLGHQRRLARSGAMSALLPISAVAADIEIGRKVPLATNSAPEKIRAVLT